MNAPGSPSSPLQTTYFLSLGLAARRCSHFRPGGEARRRRGRAGRSRGSHVQMSSSGHLKERLFKGGVAVVGKVFVQMSSASIVPQFSSTTRVLLGV